MSVAQKFTYRMNTQQGTQLTAGLTTNTTFQLSQIVSLISVGGMFSLRCHGITIPFSFYQMSSDINTISVTFTNGGSKTVNLTIPVGNYTCASVLLALSTVLTASAAITVGAYTGFTLVTNFSYNSGTGVSTLAITNPTQSFSINFGANLSAGLFFGFSASTGAVALATPRSSTQVCVANPVSYLLLRCSSLKQFLNREFIVTPDLISDVVYRIPIVTNTNTWIQYLMPSEPVFILNNDISSFTFYLTTNLTTTPINLQGLYYSFQFTLEEIVRPVFESLSSAKFVNQIMTTHKDDSELQELVRQRDAEIEKLKVYQKKLAIPEERKSREEVLASLEQPLSLGSRKGDEPAGIASVF